MLIKNYLARYVSSVDISIVEQVWVQFRNALRVVFGFVYVPPSDSQYYSHESFSAIRDKLHSASQETHHIIVGDMNTRFGTTTRDIIPLIEIPNSEIYSYPNFADKTNNANDNAEILSAICIEQSVLVVNNLKTPTSYYPGNKTFRKRNEWISEIDVCVASPSIVHRINEFRVRQDENLPSDHAHVTINVL